MIAVRRSKRNPAANENESLMANVDFALPARRKGEKQQKQQPQQQQQQQQQHVFDNKYVPSRVLFREAEADAINRFLDDPKRTFLMVTGLPGSGKTLLVNKLLDEREGAIKTIRVNAMRVQQLPDIPKRGTNTVLMVDEFESLKDPLKLLALGVKTIGLSNDTNWQQKAQVELPRIENVVFRPYSAEQVEQIVLERVREARLHDVHSRIEFEGDALRLCAKKAVNVRGGDLRNVLEVCQRAIHNRNQCVITKDDLLERGGYRDALNQKTALILGLNTQQQIILLALHLLRNTDQTELELTVVTNKIAYINKSLGLEAPHDLLDQLQQLQAYKLLDVREQRQNRQGVKVVTTKVVPRCADEEVQEAFQFKAAFKGFF